jgi:membrane protein implicated in regulation of membrane protease activity
VYCCAVDGCSQWRVTWRKKQAALEKPIVSEIQHHLMGLELVLSVALEPQAQIRVGDSYWLARSDSGQSIAIGAKVKVVAIDGTMLVVRVV